MRKIKSILLSVLALFIVAAFSSCGGSKTKSAGDTTASKGADSTTKAAAPAVATPFDVVDVIHNVKDYDKWRPVFNADSTNRKAAGMMDMALGRDADNANRILIVLKLSDVAKGRAFAADPKLKETMDKAGVTSKPDMQYYHVIRFGGNANVKQWMVVNHKVKDFAAWVKVFDGEGPAKRADEGFTDVALARGIDDTTMVHLVFGVTDMAKAKAAIVSEEKKKLMMSAGVVGKPDNRFYNAAQ